MAGKLMRAAVVGASSLLGKEVTSEIGDSAAAVWDLTLLDAGEETEGQLTVAGDEPLLIKALSPESMEGVDLVFFAGDVSVTEEYGKRALSAGAAVIDLTGALGREPGFLMRSPWLRLSKRPDLTTTGIVGPHPAALMLGIVAERLTDRFGALELAATVLEPASQAGAAGVDELHQQTVGLLSFKELPKSVFDAQIAFNVQSVLGDEAKAPLAGVRERIRMDLRDLLQHDSKATVSVNLLQAPVFHGYVISTYARFGDAKANADEVRGALRGTPVAAEEDAAPSNQASVEAGDLLASVQTDWADDGGLWLTLAADNLRLVARNAVAAAIELAALRPSTRVQ